ncbi:hypothetical protein YC2023_063935 [Brassica napus]
MAFSASSSPVSVSGSRWLRQHRDRRFWFREAVALLAPLAPASFSSYLTAIYESEPLLFIWLSSLNLVPHACGFEWSRLNSDDGAVVRRRIAEAGAAGRR